jgi:hypothetical protein
MSNIANQFTGLPTTASFIQEVGMDKDGNTKSVAFKYEDGSESVALDVPLLSIINIPSLCVDEIDVNFEMEVSTQTASKSSTDSSAELNVKAGWGCWSASFTGKVSHHSENSRKSDTSAKYSVSVKGKQEKPEGLMKVLDMLNNSIGKQKEASQGDGKG